MGNRSSPKRIEKHRPNIDYLSTFSLLIALISALDSAVVRQQRAADADASKPEPNNEKPGKLKDFIKQLN